MKRSAYEVCSESEMTHEPAAPSVFTVEVVYANAEQQLVVEVMLPAPATVAQALAAAAQQEVMAALIDPQQAVGIYGQICSREQPLRDGDRVEVYRELRMDAKTARRQRAKTQQEDA